MQGDSVPIDVNNGTAGTATASSGAGLVVTCVKIAISFAIFRRIAIQSADDARQNAELLAGVITHNPDLDTDLGKIRPQLQRRDGHVLDCFGVELEDTEIVDGVAIHGVRINLFVVVEDTVAPEGA